MVQLTYYSDPAPERPVVKVPEVPTSEASWYAAVPRGEGELRFGFTLGDVQRIAAYAVRNDRWYRAADVRERMAAAWHAAVELLYASDTAPHGYDLIDAARAAVDRLVREEMRTHGQDHHDVWAGRGVMPNFLRFWWGARQNTASPEGRIVEREALRQIWPCLSPRHREVLAALAAHGEYRAAAEALGIGYHTFCVEISQARRSFFALWHEHETPAAVWGQDRRVGAYGASEAPKSKRRPATRAVKRRVAGPKPKREPVHGKASTYANHECRCIPCTTAATEKARARRRANGAKAVPRIDDAKIRQARRMRAAGATLKTIADELGISLSHVSRLVRGYQKEAA